MRVVFRVGAAVLLGLIAGPVAGDPAREMLCLDRQRMAMDMKLAELREELRPYYQAILPQVAGWTCVPEPVDLEYEALQYDLLVGQRCRRGDEELLVQFSATDRLIANQFDADGKVYIPAAPGLSRRNPGYYRSAQGRLYRDDGRLFGRVSDAITVKIERTDRMIGTKYRAIIMKRFQGLSLRQIYPRSPLTQILRRIQDCWTTWYGSPNGGRICSDWLWNCPVGRVLYITVVSGMRLLFGRLREPLRLG